MMKDSHLEIELCMHCQLQLPSEQLNKWTQTVSEFNCSSFQGQNSKFRVKGNGLTLNRSHSEHGQ